MEPARQKSQLERKGLRKQYQVAAKSDLLPEY